jgi:hypothetical protein
MFKSIVAAVAGAALFAVGADALAGDAFAPELQKVIVNGQTLYQVGQGEAKSLTVKADAPAKIEYVFENKGSAPYEADAMVFVHFNKADKIVAGGDYKPAIATSKWEPGKQISDVKSKDFSALKGETLSVYVGVYNGNKRLDLENEGLGKDKRLPVGSLKVE